MSSASTHRHVVVVGGGITGLLAARILGGYGIATTVLERCRAPGGQIRTIEMLDHHVDLGAEAVAVASSGTQRVLEQLGLAPSAVVAGPGRTWIATSDGLRQLPAGLGPAGPSRLAPMFRSTLLTPAGKLRAGLEPLRAKQSRRLSDDADGDVASFITQRFGRQVLERVVDPLLGNLHGGEVAQLSLRACLPTLVPAATGGASLLRPRAAGPAMRFTSWPGGMRTLVDAAAAGLRIATCTEATGIEPMGDGYRVLLGDGAATGGLRADAVVAAVAPWIAAEILPSSCSVARSALSQSKSGSVATCVVALRRADAARVPALSGTGIMVPSHLQRVLKSVTFLSSKWPQLYDEEQVFLRMSAGRAGNDLAFGDADQLVHDLLEDLADLTGLRADPVAMRLQRWLHTMPQLTVGHLSRLATARADLTQHAPGLVLAGSGYDGVGLATCLRSADAASAAVLAHLDESLPDSANRPA